MRPPPLETAHAIILVIRQANILEYLTGRRRVMNIPDGAFLKSFWPSDHQSLNYNPDEGLKLALWVEHESLPAIPVGGRVPFVTAKFRRVDDAERG